MEASGLLDQKVGDAINQKACTISYPETQDPKMIKLLENASSITDGWCQDAWKSLTGIAINIAGFILYCLFLVRLAWWIPIVIIAAAVGGYYFNRHLNKWDYAHREERAGYYTRMNYVISKCEGFEIAKDIRIFGLESWLKDIYQDARNLLKAFLHKKERHDIWSNIFQIAVDLARNGIAYVYLIHMTLNEGLSVSEFLLYFTAMSTFTTWVMGILRDVSRLHKDSIDISTVREYLEYPEPFKFDDGEDIPKAPSYELKLEHVSFRYPGAEQDTIHDLNLVVRPGEKLAIVGLNGAGKTTLVKLLCGLFDPTEGRVLLNGKDIRDFDRNAYYELFSAVFQEFSLMDVTIAENVAQTTVDIDYERVRNCIEKAGLTKSINELPKGLDTHVGRNVFLDGVLFSGGQTQRLMLARALYKDGPILILDEPTAALDPIAENDIYMKYNDMTSGKTSVFISHRLASTRFCDRIIFVADGNIAEEGTHESLLALGGEYAKLFEVQSRYYQEGREF